MEDSDPGAQRRAVIAFVVVAFITSLAFVLRNPQSLIPIPMRTSLLSGQMWLDELQAGHPERFSEQFGMSKHTFHLLSCELQLHSGLRNRRYVSAEEQLATFLYFARTGSSTRILQERFQRSPSTITGSIERVLDTLVSAPFYTKYLNESPDCTPPYIENNYRFFPYFKNCRGAIDCSHFDAYVPDGAVARYRDRKGSVSQNVLAVCDFSMRFTYVLSGWEGSAADSTVYNDALRKGLSLPPDKYFLADAGFPLCDTLLTPYRATRYHLREWGLVQLRPQNARELFNLRHSMARNVIERIFGIIKRRFSLMVASPEYSEEKQAKFIPALCVLHNFISLYDQDIEDPTNPQQPLGTGGSGQAPPTNLTRPVWVSAQEERTASVRRDKIADEMWADYQLHLTKRGV